MAAKGSRGHVMCQNLMLCMQVGPQGVGLKVKDPKKYHFDPKSLLLQICEVCALPGCMIWGTCEILHLL